MYKVAILLPILFPFFGLVYLLFNFESSADLFEQSFSYVPILTYTLFLFGSALAFFLCPKINHYSLDKSINLKKFNLKGLYFLYFLLVFFVLWNYDFFSLISGDISKEDIRRSGFLNAMLTKYIIPSFFAFFCILKVKGRGINSLIFLVVFLFAFLTGMSAGGKASGILSVLPGIIVLLHCRLNLRIAILVFVSFFAFVFASAYYFDSFLSGDFEKILSYIIKRAFLYTAEVPYKVSYLYFYENLDFSYFLTLSEIMSKSFLVYFVSTDEIHKYLFSQSVTHLLYPEMLSKISDGSWNLAPNVFVESLFIGGYLFLPLFGFLSVYMGFCIYKVFFNFIEKGFYVLAAITIVYFVFVYVSWLNSSGVVHLFHPLMFISLSLSYLIISIFSKVRIK